MNDVIPSVEKKDGISDLRARVNAIARTGSTSPTFVFSLRTFLKRSGGSIFYCLSALAILYGLVQIIGPILARNNSAFLERLMCVATLHLYELALLGVLALIVAWQRVTDDAISLVILIGIFLIAGGIAVETIAMDSPRIAMAVGAASLALALAKLTVMRNRAGVRIGGLFMWAIVLLLGWNFFISPIIADELKTKLADKAVLRTLWQKGWVIMLGSGVLMLVHAVRSDPGDVRRLDSGKPFLHTSGMTWVFGLVLFLVAAVHQHALPYGFYFPYKVGDYLPMLLIVSLLGVVLSRTYAHKVPHLQAFFALVPLAATMTVQLSGSFMEGPKLGLGTIWYPPAILAVMCIGLLLMALQTRRRDLLSFSGLYLIAVILTMGATPADPRALNWMLGGSLLGVSLLVASIVLDSPSLALATVVLVSIGSLHADWLDKLGHYLAMPEASVFALVAGGSTMLVYLWFRRRLPRVAAVFAALLLSAGCIVACSKSGEPGEFAVGALLIGMLGFVVWRRTRDMMTAGILAFPLARTTYLLLESAGAWRYVMLSFVLLAIGAFVSLRKGGVKCHPERVRAQQAWRTTEA